MSSSEVRRRSEIKGQVFPYAVSDLTDPEFQDALRSTRTALLPIGSLEQHGPHLPVSTDSVIVEHIASSVAGKLQLLLLPAIRVGVSFEHAPMLNVSITSQTLSALVGDICVAVSENGLNDIVLLNGHHGNMGSLQYISQEVASRVSNEFRIYTLHYWHFIRSEFDHAGNTETSMMLAIAPRLVQMDKAKASSKSLTESKAVYSVLTNIPGSFPKITGNGVWGDPRKASAETGRILLEQAVQGLVSTIRELQKFRKVEL